MRYPIIIVLALSACSEPPPAPEAASAASPAAGQWEITRQVTSLVKMDDGAAAIKAKPGDTSSLSVCLAEADRAKPSPELITARAEANCTYDNLYLSSGHLNAGLSCSPKGLGGKLQISTNGSFTADRLDLSLSGSTQLAGSGDVRIEEKITGRRTGACTAG